jgi:CheY-like chemotaxis protein
MEAPAHVRQVVLVVEDEPLLGLQLVDLIEEAGFDVVLARDADDAISQLERRADITILFTDIQMPGSMDGLKLARAVRNRWPPIKIIATSGNATLRDGDLPDGGRFLPKPYDRTRITDTLLQMTAAG